jgi:uncharacterized damage-inducible protein DinB
MDLIIEGFEYDRWANRQWFAYLEGEGWPEADREIFRHILSAQEAWLSRVDGISLNAMPRPSLTLDTLEALHGRWVSVLREHPEDPVIAYRRITGDAHAQPLGRIARHVVNHGTYHRGELRGLCRARNATGFPETDQIAFYTSRD